MHVFSDLKPYICTSSMCSQELVQFPTRKAWAEHEFSEHHQLHAWKCSKCTAEYTDLEQLREHMQTSHTDILSQAHLGVAMELSLDRREKLIIESPCPLCLAPTGSSRREYVKHVGRHMEEIALIVLPKEDGHSDESSDESSNEELVEISSSTSKRHNKAQASQGDAVLIDFLRGSHPDTSSATNSAAHVPRISRRSPSPGQTRSESSSLPTDLVEGDREDLVGVARPAAKGQGINARFSPVPKGYKPLKEWSCGWCHFGPMTINFEMFCANCQRMKDDYATCR